MLDQFKTRAALLVSAAFVIHSQVFAQAPIIDAGVERRVSPSDSQQRAPRLDQEQANPGQDGGNYSELFYQMQLLQQEVMQLRGQVEEQSHQLQRLKEQNMERYIDLDRRIGKLSEGGVMTPDASAAGADGMAAPVRGPAMEGEKEAYEKAYSLVINKQFDDALAAFEQFLADFPNGQYTPNSYYWMGELYQVITPANLDAARESFSQLLTQYPDHAKVPDAMYKLGKVYFLKGDRDASREWLEKVIARYGSGGNSSAADKARQFLNANF